MRKFVSGLLIFTIYWSMFVPFALDAEAQVLGKARDIKMKDIPAGLKFRLSEGAEGAESRLKQPLATADPLSDGDAGKVLGRLPAIKTDPDDKTDFAKRIGTLPAPKTGNKIPVKFPAPDQAGLPNTDGAKQIPEVIRFSPEGEVPLAPDLSVTFSQPMVSVTSQEEAAKYAPVELTPQVEGRWRWLGTKTLMFDTDKRFPMATKFTARVSAGTKSATGQATQKDFIWTFTTPSPKVVQMIPQGQTVRRNAMMFVSFDQAINPEAVIKTITVNGGGKKLPIRLATQEEIDRDGSISYYSKQSQPGRWLAFRALAADGSVENALPPASGIGVTIETGTPSAEGPLTTQKPQAYSFQTYGPFKYNTAYCGWRDNKNCSPFEAWYIEFNNSIDSSKFAKEMVKIDPPVEGLNIYPSGNNIYFQGYKKGRTSYKITIDGGLTDIFGQTLGAPATATIRVGSAAQNLYAQGGNMVVLDPTSKPTYSIYSTNHNSVKVRMYSVKPEDWHQFQQYVRRINYDDGQRPAIPGRLISDNVVQVKNTPDEMAETRIDLASALNGGFGNVIIDIEPTVKKDKYDRTRVFTWIQSTQIGLDAFVDNSELVGFATELKTGRPMSGVEFSIFPNGKSVVSGQSSVVSKEQGFFGQVWDWITGARGPNAGDTESVNADGSEAAIETIEAAQADKTPDNGILRMQLPETVSQKGMNLLIARRGKDTAFLPENTDYYWQDYGNWYKKLDSDSLRWFVFDDRKMYKPKEEVAVKGYIRRLTGGKLGDIEGLGTQTLNYAWSAKDPRNNEIAKGTVTTNPFGAFDFKFSLPDNTNLGYGRIDFTETGSTSVSYSHQFQIQEFRRPEFEVS
ncbi:MAG: Ig-like domain-containing protein, partial [Blastocatellia bacterium]